MCLSLYFVMFCYTYGFGHQTALGLFRIGSDRGEGPQLVFWHKTGQRRKTCWNYWKLNKSKNHWKTTKHKKTLFKFVFCDILLLFALVWKPTENNKKYKQKQTIDWNNKTNKKSMRKTIVFQTRPDQTMVFGIRPYRRGPDKGFGHKETID